MKRLTVEELEKKSTDELNELLEKLHDDYANQIGDMLEISSYIMDVEHVLETEVYFALYDLQLDGFKAGYAGESYQKIVRDGAHRAYELSQSDEEPCSDDLADEDILEVYGYEVRRVTKEEYEKILNSDEVGLSTTVSL